MNERIRELFHEATFDESSMIDGVYHPYISLQSYREPMRYSITKVQYEKFAELIVRECAQVIKDCEQYGCSKPVEFELLERFGIE